MENTKLKIQQALTKKALEDVEFKNSLLASPIETLASVGLEVENPNNNKFMVVDQTDPNKIFINIPPMPLGSDLELTDEQLEIVAGGAGSECDCDVNISIKIEGNNNGDIIINL